jgi:hypothetical protein
MTGGDLERTLRCATAALEHIGVAFHVTGGLASSYYGEPRLSEWLRSERASALAAR